MGVSAVGQHVQQILDQATKAAGEIEAKARDDAAMHAREAQLKVDREIEERQREFVELARSLVDRTERLRQEVDDLNASLGEAARRARQPPPSVAGTPRSEERPQDMTAARRAELFATQMAMAGSGRVAIERALRDELGIEEPTALVDRVLS